MWTTGVLLVLTHPQLSVASNSLKKNERTKLLEPLDRSQWPAPCRQDAPVEPDMIYGDVHGIYWGCHGI